MPRLGALGSIGASTQSEIEYVERATDATINATTAPTANLVIASSTFTFGGATTIEVYFYCAVAQPNNNGITLIVHLWEDATDLGAIAFLADTGGQRPEVAIFVKRRLTPAAGAHQYSVRARVSGGTATIFGNPASGDNLRPMFIQLVALP